MSQGVIPADRTQNLGGSWSALTAAGEATNLNIVHLSNIDCTDVEDLTKVTCDVIWYLYINICTSKSSGFHYHEFIFLSKCHNLPIQKQYSGTRQFYILIDTDQALVTSSSLLRTSPLMTSSVLSAIKKTMYPHVAVYTVQYLPTIYQIIDNMWFWYNNKWIIQIVYWAVIISVSLQNNTFNWRVFTDTTSIVTYGNKLYICYGYYCSLPLRRAARGSKLMCLELIHGLFIT